MSVLELFADCETGNEILARLDELTTEYTGE